jgi:hypothetical protein
MISNWRGALELDQHLNEFRETNAYATLRPYLRKDVVQRLEGEAIHIQLLGRGAGVSNYKTVITDEIARIEREWMLV